MSEQDDEVAVRAAAAGSAAAGAPMFNRAAWLRILPFAAYLLFIVIGDLLERMGTSAAVMRWLYPVKIGVVTLLLALFWRRYRELFRAPAGNRLSVAQAAIAVLVGVVVLILWVNLDKGWMVVGTAAGYDPRVEGAIDPVLVAIRIAGAALVVPVMEELFWRSFMMRWIVSSEFESVDPSQLGLKACLITILLFGIEHNLWLAGIVAGAAYSGLYILHRNLWSPILAHAVTNGMLGVWVVWTGNWSFW